MNEENAKTFLFEIADVAEAVRIPFMLYGGTCLGAVREGKFIDVDEDIDFACLSEDFIHIAQYIADAFAEAGMQVELVDHRHDRPWSGIPYGIKLHKHGINSDFFCHTSIGGRRFVPSHLGEYCLVHKAEHLEQLVTVDFYGRPFHIPREYTRFLEDKYGDWKVPHKEFANVSQPTCRKDCKDGNDFWWI